MFGLVVEVDRDDPSCIRDALGYGINQIAVAAAELQDAPSLLDVVLYDVYQLVHMVLKM